MANIGLGYLHRPFPFHISFDPSNMRLCLSLQVSSFLASGVTEFGSAVFGLAFSGVWRWLLLVCCIFRSSALVAFGLLHFQEFGVPEFGSAAFSGVWRSAFGSDFLHLVIYPNESLTLTWCWGLILLRRPTSSISFCLSLLLLLDSY